MKFIAAAAWLPFACLASPLGAQSMPDPEPSPDSRRFNVPLPTLGGTQLWADELHFHKWRIQRNILTGRCRLLDGANVRHAWGDFEECRRRLEEIKQQRNLPPMEGKAVLVLHGLFRTRHAMKRLATYLERPGGYRAFRISYPSTRGNVEEHAAALAKLIENLEGIEEINFVCHSLGCLVVRRYLAAHSDSATGQIPDPRIRRMVMLAPPNHGAQLAKIAAYTGLFQIAAGSGGSQFVQGWDELEKRLAIPEFEFGIIAGGAGREKGRNPLLTGDDDLVVTVEETRLPGARDFLVLPVTHTFMMNDRRLQECTLRFLQRGCFVSEEERKPIPHETRDSVEETE
ncbi:MAG: lipase [Planctomycetes bacterium]|nr:lipase [Planctomycetota bacterium]